MARAACQAQRIGTWARSASSGDCGRGRCESSVSVRTRRGPADSSNCPPDPCSTRKNAAGCCAASSSSSRRARSLRRSTASARSSPRRSRSGRSSGPAMRWRCRCCSPRRRPPNGRACSAPAVRWMQIARGLTPLVDQRRHGARRALPAARRRHRAALRRPVHPGGAGAAASANGCTPRAGSASASASSPC